MIRYTDLVARSLTEAGVDVQVMLPRRWLNLFGQGYSGWSKYLGYVDKLLLAPGALRRAAAAADLVHVADHSNAFYVPRGLRSRPWVVTCHDLIAVRGALGEMNDYPPSALGRQLQAMILRGLRRADGILCVSKSTHEDVLRLVGPAVPSLVVPNGLNYAYGRLQPAVAWQRLAAFGLQPGSEFLLHVGSDHARKNRDLVIHALAGMQQWQGRLVLVGPPLSAASRALAQRLGVLGRIVDGLKPDNAQLEALYNCALALVFPSRHEGFGWPLVEAQACGCPVVCSSIPPMPEVTGGAALYADADRPEEFTAALQSLVESPARRSELVLAGAENASRYLPVRMAADMITCYKQTIARHPSVQPR